MDPQLLQEIELLHDQVCHALGDPTRISILYLLFAQEQCVNDLANALSQPQSTISRHLKILRDRALVNTTREGTTIYYSLADKRIVQALDLLRGLLHDRLAQQLKVVASDK
ncbi:MAG: metalloregulator ArsR/SmtB family transcription factor [Anaerolineae bacterium]